MYWFPTALLSAILLASSDALTKRYLPDWDWRDILLVRFGIGGMLLLPLLLARPPDAMSPEQWLWLALSLPLELLAMRLYVSAIQNAPLSHTLPYLAFTPVFTTAFGLLVLNETVSAPGLAGMLLVVSGAYLLNIRHAFNSPRLDLTAPLRAIVREPAARMMLAAAFIYGITSVTSKAAMGDLPPYTFGALYFILIGAATVPLIGGLNRSRLRCLRSRPWPVFAIALTMALMSVAHFTAIAEVEAAYMITVKRSSLLFGMLYGAWWFHERDLAHNLGAGVLMVTGVGLVLL